MRIFLFVFGLMISELVFAICPLCTFAVGAGIGLSQCCGIDDTVTGLWIGGFIVSLVALTKNWFKKKNIDFFGYVVVIAVFYYVITIWPLYLNGIIGHTLNKLWGIDRLLLGMMIGSIAFFVAAVSYSQLKKNNNNRAYFPFQKVIMPLVMLIILSVIFYIITK